MKPSAKVDLPWFWGGDWEAEAGLKSSLGAQLDAMRQGTTASPSPAAAEDLAIERCWSAHRAWQIRRRLEACGPEVERILELHHRTAKRLPAGISPAAMLTAEALSLPAVANASAVDREHHLSVLVARALNEASVDDRHRVAVAADLLVARAERAYDTAAVPKANAATFDEPSRKALVRYS